MFGKNKKVNECDKKRYEPEKNRNYQNNETEKEYNKYSDKKKYEEE